MLRCKRPRRPAGFAATALIAERLVENAIAAGSLLNYDENIWGAHKPAFLSAQHGKCGYCEQPSCNHPGAMDHYAPKAEIGDLMEHGQEVDATPKVVGRLTPTRFPTGYWWLAYSWDNWLYTCERCNTGWKRTLFPIQERYRTAPSKRKKFSPLLLNPFGPIDPIHHLAFTPLGQILAYRNSPRGEATIRTCGLDRETLRAARAGIAADTHRFVDRLLASIASNDALRAHDAATDLLALGADDRPHAGMVRSIVKRTLGRSWKEMVTLQNIYAGRIPASARRA